MNMIGTSRPYWIVGDNADMRGRRDFQSVFGYGSDINYDLRLCRQGGQGQPEETIYADR